MKQSEIQKYFSILLLLEFLSFSDLGQHLTTVNIVKIGVNLERTTVKCTAFCPEQQEPHKRNKKLTIYHTNRTHPSFCWSCERFFAHCLLLRYNTNALSLLLCTHL